MFPKPGRRAALLLLASLVFHVTTSARAAMLLDDQTKPRARLIIDNDFGGDPDGLFQLAHHLLCPTMDVRGVISSQHYEGGFYGLPGSPEHGAEVATGLLRAMGLNSTLKIETGDRKSVV